MSNTVEVSYGIDPELPHSGQLIGWAENALLDLRQDVSLAIRIVDRIESQELNRKYRGQDRPTNVLAFPAELPLEVGLDLLGDIVICAPVVEAEAATQRKPSNHHWAHMVTHGVLHLLGHDHLAADEADRMEQLERQILARISIADPYEPR